VEGEDFCLVPPRPVLEQKLHDAVRLARARLADGKKA
jgi:hypothetical protein